MNAEKVKKKRGKPGDGGWCVICDAPCQKAVAFCRTCWEEMRADKRLQMVMPPYDKA